MGLYSTLQLGSGGILASGDNRAIVSSGYFLSVLLGNGLALTVLISGVVALYTYLANGGQGALALGAMGFSILGIALNLMVVEGFASAIPAPSRSYLSGLTESIRILDQIFAGPLGIAIDSGVLALLRRVHPLWRGHMALWCVAKVGGSTRGGPCPSDLRAVFGGRDDLGDCASGRGRWIDSPERFAGIC